MYFQVPSYLISVLLEREAKLAKRCARLGVVAPVVNVIRYWVQTSLNELGVEISTPMAEYEVVGDTPKLAGGWQVVASVQHLSAGNIVSIAPAFRDEPLQGLLNAPATCDHCGHNRARKLTVVVRDEAGNTSRVGTDCLRDFTGHNLPAVWENFSDDFDLSDGDSLRAIREPYSITSVIATALACIAKYGWVKSANDDGSCPTATRTEVAMRGKDNDLDVSADDYSRANRAIAWITSTTEDFGYIANLRVAVLSLAYDKNWALIVSLARAFDAHEQSEARKTIREAERADEVRTPCLTGRIQIAGVVVATDIKENDFGIRCVMTVKDDRGFTVWGTTPSSLEPSVGDRVQFTATVERSDRDECFGFYSRPAKASLLATA